MKTLRKSDVCHLIVILLLPACHYPRYFTEPGDNVYLMADYDDAVDLWTSHDEVHHELIGVADLNGMYRSWEVRQAHIQALKNRGNSNEAMLERIIERELNRYRQGHEFYLGLYCFKEEWNKLSGVDPIWHLSLCSDTASSVNPIIIEKLEPSPDEAWMDLSDLSRGRQLYRVMFPLTDQDGQPIINKSTRKIVLMCDSLIGNLTLAWKLGPIPEQLK